MCFFKKKKKEVKEAPKQVVEAEQAKVTATVEKPAEKKAESKPATAKKTTASKKPVAKTAAKTTDKKPTTAKKTAASKLSTTKKTATNNTEIKDSSPKDYHISQREDGKWQVKAAKAGKALKLFDTQAEAVEYAKKTADNQDGSFTIHKKDGKIRKQKY